MSPLLDSPLTESRHETRTDTTRTPGALSGTDGSNPAPSSGGSAKLSVPLGVIDEVVPLEAWRPQGEVRSGRTGRRLLQNPVR